MTDEYLRGKEIGKIMQGMKDLGRNVDSGFAEMNVELKDVKKEFKEEFKSLDCSANKEKLTILYTDYIDRKDTKKFLFRTAIKKVFPLLLKSGSIIGAIAGTVYACIN